MTNGERRPFVHFLVTSQLSPLYWLLRLLTHGEKDPFG